MDNFQKEIGKDIAKEHHNKNDTYWDQADFQSGSQDNTIKLTTQEGYHLTPINPYLVVRYASFQRIPF